MNPGEAGYIDMKNQRQVILHFRDLINIGPILEMDVNKEIWNFKVKCKEADYSTEQIEVLVEKACMYTIYEQRKQIPRLIKDKGDRTEWAQNKGRYNK